MSALPTWVERDKKECNVSCSHIDPLRKALEIAWKTLERINKVKFVEGKTGDPLYLLELCQEEAQEALQRIAEVGGEK